MGKRNDEESDGHDVAEVESPNIWNIFCFLENARDYVFFVLEVLKKRRDEKEIAQSNHQIYNIESNSIIFKRPFSERTVQMGIIITSQNSNTIY